MTGLERSSPRPARPKSNTGKTIKEKLKAGHHQIAEVPVTQKG